MKKSKKAIKKKRKLIQLTAIPETRDHYSCIFGLCDDGSVYKKSFNMSEPVLWKKMKDIPQDPGGE